MTEIGWLDERAHSVSRTRLQRKELNELPLNAINPLDSFNKGLEVMCREKNKTKRRLCTWNYSAVILMLWLILMLIYGGDRNGLSMRLKVKTPGNNWMCWAGLSRAKYTSAARLVAEKKPFSSSLLFQFQSFREDTVATTNIPQSFRTTTKKVSFDQKICRKLQIPLIHVVTLRSTVPIL